MSIRDESLNTEAPWIIAIASRRKVLTKSEEYELIKVAKPSIRAQRLVNRKKYQKSLDRRPALRASLEKLGQSGMKEQKILLEHNYRLIIHTAKKLHGRGLSWEDMIQHGSDGFLYAVSRFDTTTNNKLSTYASQWIRQRISRAIENTGRIIRIPIHMQAKINDIRYIYRKYVQEKQENPSSEEITTIYNLNTRNKKNFKPITKEEAEELGRHLQDIHSLDDSAGDDDNLSVLHYVEDEKSSVVENTEEAANKEYLASLLSTLPKDEQEFMKFRFGLVDGAPKTDGRTGEVFGMTVREVREKERAILDKLTNKANPNKTSLDFELENLGLILLSAPPESIPIIEEFFSTKVNFFPCRIYTSTDKEQMTLLLRRVQGFGGRAEVISSFN